MRVKINIKVILAYQVFTFNYLAFKIPFTSVFCNDIMSIKVYTVVFFIQNYHTSEILCAPFYSTIVFHIIIHRENHYDRYK